MAGRPKKDDSREKQYRVRLNDEEDKNDSEIYCSTIISNKLIVDIPPFFILIYCKK